MVKGKKTGRSKGSKQSKSKGSKQSKSNEKDNKEYQKYRIVLLSLYNQCVPGRTSFSGRIASHYLVALLNHRCFKSEHVSQVFDARLLESLISDTPKTNLGIVKLLLDEIMDVQECRVQGLTCGPHIYRNNVLPALRETLYLIDEDNPLCNLAFVFPDVQQAFPDIVANFPITQVPPPTEG